MRFLPCCDIVVVSGKFLKRVWKNPQDRSYFYKMKTESIIQVADKEFELYISFSKIKDRIEQLGAELNEAYAGLDPVFVPVLNGSFMFASDLIREVCIPCEVSFVKTASYEGTVSSGLIKEVIGLGMNLKNRHVVLVEDIVDTGKTVAALLEGLKMQEPASMEIASMFVKPDAFTENFEVRFRGFDIPDKFIVGYGLDYNGYGRNFRDIYSLAGSR